MSDSNTSYKKRGKDYPIKGGLRTLPGKYYHSQEIYEEELEKIFYQKWMLAGRGEEIPEAGDYKLFDIEDEIHQICPIAYWHVWDNRPTPRFNKVLYESTDVTVQLHTPAEDMDLIFDSYPYEPPAIIS